MKKILLILSIFVACIMTTMFVSCEKTDKLDNYISTDGTSRNDFGKKYIPVSEVRITSMRQNAYSMTNMRAAYNQLVSAGQIAPMTIRPTHLYIRINVRDSADLTRLVEDTTIELFNYPLESELSGDGYYIPPASESNIVYTVVPIDYDLQGLSYGLLDTCCIPDDDCSDDMWLVEWTALEMTGNTGDDDKFMLPTRCSGQSGSIEVENTGTTGNVGVRRVKVVMNVLVKVRTTFTRDDGGYNSDYWFLVKPNYTIKFKNKSKFWIWGNNGLIIPAYYTYKSQPKDGFSVTYPRTDTWPWYYSTVNNAASIYYEHMCVDFKILKPVDNLRIWATPFDFNDWLACTPMFRHFFHMGTFCDFISTYHIFSGVTLMGLILPDMLVYMPYNSTPDIYRTMFHELAHASHYTQVGNQYWGEYIQGIIYNGGYGSDTNVTNAGYIGIGEMWGNYAEYKMFNYYWEYYEGLTGVCLSVVPDTDKWYKPQILCYLNQLPIKQLENCKVFQYLTAVDNNHKYLRDTLMSLFPGFSTDIYNIFDTTVYR